MSSNNILSIIFPAESVPVSHVVHLVTSFITDQIPSICCNRILASQATSEDFLSKGTLLLLSDSDNQKPDELNAHMKILLERVQGINLEKRTVVVVGVGDEALFQLGQFVVHHNGVLFAPSLRILEPYEQEEMIAIWCKEDLALSIENLQ